MKNLKIKTKFIIGIGLSIFILAVSCVLSISALNTASSSLRELSEEELPTIITMWEGLDHLMEGHIYAYEAILAAGDLSIVEPALANMSVSLTDAQESLNSLNVSSDSEELFAQVTTGMQSSIALFEQIGADLMANTDASMLNARNTMRDTLTPIMHQLEGAIETHVMEYSTEVMAKTNSESTVATTSVYFCLGIVGFSLITSVLASIWLLRSIFKPIRVLSSIATEFNKGNLNIQERYESNDEIGVVVAQFKETAETLSSYVGTIEFATNKFANKDFVLPPLEKHFEGDFFAIEKSFLDTAKAMSEVMGKINNSSAEVANSADQVASGAQSLAQGATEQAGSLEELTSTIADVSDKVTQNAANANKASDMAQSATTAMSECNNYMHSLMNSMSDIDEKSQEINNIIKTIEDIAFQTNILALNAAVEAARAGAEGKGFAVVADEVRMLATKSAEAAQSTSELINASITAIADGVKLAQVTADQLDNVAIKTAETTDLILEITNDSNTQADAISQVTIGLEQISIVVQTNSATSEESSAASEELLSQSNVLKSLVSEFKLVR